MGNEISSPRRDDEDTVMSAVSGWSHDDGDKGRSKSGRRKNEGRGGFLDSSGFFDNICGRMGFDDDDEAASRKIRKNSSQRRSGSEEESDDDTYNDDADRDRDRRKSSSRDNRKSKSERTSSRSIEDVSVTDEEEMREERGKTESVSFDSAK